METYKLKKQLTDEQTEKLKGKYLNDKNYDLLITEDADGYDVNGIERDMCLKMVELWGDNICQHIVKPDGRNDLKIHWNNINTNQTTLF